MPALHGPRSMARRTLLLIWTFCLVAAAMLVMGVVSVLTLRDRLEDRLDDDLSVTEEYLPFLEGMAASGAFDTLDALPLGTPYAFMFLDATGDITEAIPLRTTEGSLPLPDLSGHDLADLRERAGDPFKVGSTGDGSGYRVVSIDLGDAGVVVQAASLEQIDATVRGQIKVVGGATLLGLGLLGVALWYLIRRGLRPINDMIATAGAIGEGDLSRRVACGENTEADQLARALNAMLENLEGAFAERTAADRRLRRFVSDASHELRTPLASIRGYADLYLTGAATDDHAVAKAMTRISSESGRMGAIVDDLLLLARLDQGRAIDRQPVAVDVLVADAAADARAVEPDRPVSIAVDGVGPFVVLGDEHKLRQAVGNLLANVRMHTSVGTPATVGVGRQGDDIRLWVADEGSGMDADAAAHVFDRFYRADPARSRAAGGTGLGLSIVASVIAAHGGSVEVDSAPGRGTTFTLSLPAVVEAPADDPIAKARAETPAADSTDAVRSGASSLTGD